ncbi:MAG: hypothetical protein IJU76_01155 [Desulfovibrionaceae bacterium]|nr:hypothetical protein [Desulfovibrionaceae bacterium]
MAAIPLVREKGSIPLFTPRANTATDTAPAGPGFSCAQGPRKNRQQMTLGASQSYHIFEFCHVGDGQSHAKRMVFCLPDKALQVLYGIVRAWATYA